MIFNLRANTHLKQIKSRLSHAVGISMLIN